ncbi:MAG: aminodeoxychorismate/anthranilate synthase component II [Desulfosalsimonas sp.]|uniref:anthranilate synthase component II n=1 Tax=Desulfosalsimonas sp. TaxID=3073848 RepID=UPI0039704E9D
MAGLLVIDNYDSFTHNLVQMFMRYDLEISVFRADCITLEQIPAHRPDYLLISPGPRAPEQAGVSVEAVRSFAGRIPVLGVCLGMQCINAAFGGKTLRAPVPVHGKTSRIFHDRTGLFENIESPFTATRYHSLVIDGRGRGLRACAWTRSGVIMGIADQGRRLFGVQFHPESFMTQNGFALVESFLSHGPLNLREHRK